MSTIVMGTAARYKMRLPLRHARFPRRLWARGGGPRRRQRGGGAPLARWVVVQRHVLYVCMYSTSVAPIPPAFIRMGGTGRRAARDRWLCMEAVRRGGGSPSARDMPALGEARRVTHSRWEGARPPPTPQRRPHPRRHPPLPPPKLPRPPPPPPLADGARPPTGAPDGHPATPATAVRASGGGGGVGGGQAGRQARGARVGRGGGGATVGAARGGRDRGPPLWPRAARPPPPPVPPSPPRCRPIGM